MTHEDTTNIKTRSIDRLKALAAAKTWALRHHEAARHPRTLHERALVTLFRGWLCYADAHHAAYGSGIGEDGVLGPAWAGIGARLRELLNGDLGRLDGGTLDRLLCDTLRRQDFDPDAL